MGIMSHFTQTVYMDFHRHIHRGEDMKRLHALYLTELDETIVWIKKRFPLAHGNNEMNVYDITLAIGLDWDDREVSPEHIVIYLLREGKIKSRKKEDVAEYIILNDIKEAIKDDVNTFKQIYPIIKKKVKSGERIAISNFANELGIKQSTLKKYITSLKKEISK